VVCGERCEPDQIVGDARLAVDSTEITAPVRGRRVYWGALTGSRCPPGTGVESPPKTPTRSLQMLAGKGAIADQEAHA
jgi:hypothetical protein